MERAFRIGKLFTNAHEKKKIHKTKQNTPCPKQETSN
jgi:hypothetical protein